MVKGSSFKYSLDNADRLFEFFLSICHEYKDKDVILDRFFVSNIVYANLYSECEGKKIHKLNDNQLNIIRELTENSIFVYFYDTPQNIYNRMSIRGDEYIELDIDKISAINDEYIKNFDLMNNDMFMYNCSMNTYEQLKAFLSVYVEKNKSVSFDKDGLTVLLEEFEINKLLDSKEGFDLDINVGSTIELSGGNKLVLSSDMFLPLKIVRIKNL